MADETTYRVTTYRSHYVPGTGWVKDAEPNSMRAYVGRRDLEDALMAEGLRAAAYRGKDSGADAYQGYYVEWAAVVETDCPKCHGFDPKCDWTQESDMPKTLTESEITRRIWDALAQGALPVGALYRIAGVAKLTAQTYVETMLRRGLIQETKPFHYGLVCRNAWHVAESLGWMRCPECPALGKLAEPAAVDVVKEILRTLDVPVSDIRIVAPVTGDNGGLSRHATVAIRLAGGQEYRISVEELG